MQRRELNRREFGGLALGATLAVGGTLALGARPAQAATTVSVWHIFGNQTEPGLANIARFNETSKTVQIDGKFIPFGQLSQQLIKGVATGDVPDLITVDNPTVASFADQDVLTDLTARVKASSVVKQARYFPGAWTNSIWNGKQFAVPGEVNTLVLYINQDMFRARGLDPTKPPQTWAELTDAAAKLTDTAAGKYGIGFSAIQTEEGTFQWLPFLYQSGATLASLGSPDATAALELWVNWVQKGYASRDVLVKRQFEMTDAWVAGNTGITISGPWELPRINRDAKFAWTAAPMPVREGRNLHSTALGGYVWAIPNGAKNTDAAFEVIEFMSQPEQMARSYVGGRLPPAGDVKPQAGLPHEDVYEMFMRELQPAHPRGPSPAWPQISEALQRAIQEGLTGRQTPARALQTASVTIAPLLKQFPIQGM